MKRFSYLLTAVVAFALIATACGGDDGGELGLVKDGTLSVCSEIPYEPFEFEVDGEYTGFDIEVIGAVADELGLELEVLATGFTAITSGSAMAADQCDIAASAITITDEREEAIDFASPYFDADQSLLVKGDSGFASLDDLVGSNLGVQSGTTGEAYAQDNAPSGIEIVSYDNGGDLFLALEAGAIDGVLQDLPVNGYRAVGDSSVAVVATYPTGEQYGFAVAEEGKEDLLKSVNDALAALRDNGTYDSIFAKWFG
ncbi:MAG: transporter substrate-binding domain-containing protein [Acidimicrobiia bacterium]|nr:transporter substrate-binding domain-containing protein [Acidimicrobiia bacterium]MDX2467355.1 transporter substrate-binding domain-containing protein [Acidimicrobiia bacterium]